VSILKEDALLGWVGELFSARPLPGRVVVLTGATAGIGRATVERLAARGAIVVAVARNADALKRLAAHVDGVVPIPCDVSGDVDRAALIAEVTSQQGRIDVLISNVGIGWAGLVEDMSLEQIRSMVETNVIGSADLARLVLPDMVRRGSGDIVFTASGASWFSTPPLTVYSATKYAIEGFAEGLRREVLTRGVRVHTVHPGLVSTQFAARAAGTEPGDVDGTPKPGPGVSPDRVASAIERLLERGGVSTVSVPRVLGLTRVVKLPPLQQAADLLLGMTAQRLARVGRDVAVRAAGPHAS
jgi:short-subunit dehydrogenase